MKKENRVFHWYGWNDMRLIHLLPYIEINFDMEYVELGWLTVTLDIHYDVLGESKL
tara:strand:+ start:12767 stop:12934 length:168 start_codon:yes stop_codon:yes gene_type:complete